MTAEEHLHAYEAALATQDWEEVDPLLHDDVCVTFSNGTFHQGKEAVEAAFTRNFELIDDERRQASGRGRPRHEHAREGRRPLARARRAPRPEPKPDPASLTD